MIQVLQRLPFLLELFFNGSFIFLFSLKIADKIPPFMGESFVQNFLTTGVLFVPLFIGIQTIYYYYQSSGLEDFLRRYIFSVIVLVPLIITWGDLDFAYWLSSAHLLASIMALYDTEGSTNPFEERLNKRQSWTRYIKLSPAQVILLSFSGVILLGTFLLMLPIASTTETSFGFMDALFMATSATCVTGLATLSVATDFSLFGQLVLLTLFQIGGLSIMTLYSSVAILLGRSMQMRDRVVMQDLLDVNSLDELLAMILDILKYTFVIELWGAVILTIGFIFEGMEFGQALYYGVFHSVSAFCNAGLSLFPNSLESYATSPLVHGTVAVLATIGGLGFIVLKELKEIFIGKRLLRNLTLHTRIVLVSSFILTSSGAILFFFSEFLNTLDGFSLIEKTQIAIFQSAMTRSTGFNSIPYDQMMPYTVYLMTLFMFVGGSPGSTAGGVKTTTLAILLYSIIATLRSAKVVTIYDREIPSHIIVKVTAITFLSILIICFSTFLLLFLEPNFSFMALFFEVVSAAGTVGLSLGITADLSVGSKIWLSILMLVGRIGPLTLVLAIGQQAFKGGKIDYPDGRVMIG